MCGWNTLYSKDVIKNVIQKVILAFQFAYKSLNEFNDGLFVINSSRSKCSRSLTCNCCKSLKKFVRSKKKQCEICKFKDTSSIQANFVEDEIELYFLIFTDVFG